MLSFLVQYNSDVMQRKIFLIPKTILDFLFSFCLLHIAKLKKIYNFDEFLINKNVLTFMTSWHKCMKAFLAQNSNNNNNRL